MDTVRIGPLQRSGSKVYCHAIGAMDALERLARYLRHTERTITVKQDARGFHLDLNEHQRELALRLSSCVDAAAVLH